MHKNKLIIFLLLIISTSSLVVSQDIKVGDKAKDFSLPYATKDTIVSELIKLNRLLGKIVIIIAFYPADWSPGCTKQLCLFRDNFKRFSQLNAEILAISGDYVWSHNNWAEHQNYPFKLLSDHNHKVAKLYESYNEDNGYNKRTVFVINQEGFISYIDWKYDVSGDTSFNNLQKALQQIHK